MGEKVGAIYDAVLNGRRADAEAGVGEALAKGISPEEILNDGLIAAMKEVGNRFECGEYYVPEMLIAARAMQSGLAVLKPQLAQSGVKAKGKAVIGSVRGDLHDIGKNLVAMMLEGAGFEVVNLGTDVSPERFAQAVREHAPQLVGMSALLTTTMPSMKATIEAIEDIGLRGKVKILIGGAPISEDFAKRIGADGYAPDASRAVTLAKQLLQ